MNKAAELNDVEARQKAQAERHLAEAQRILRELQQERRRSERRRAKIGSIVDDVKLILRAA